MGLFATRRKTVNQRTTPPIAIALVAIVLTLAVALVFPVALRATGASVQTFDITASRFEFQPDTIEVTQGDRVKVTLHSADTKHGFAIAELKVKTAIPKGGAPVVAEFVADKPGTFQIKCSEYCGPGHKTMMGTIVVAPKGGQ
jgi:cytochrome c oxidase subunit 2